MWPRVTRTQSQVRVKSTDARLLAQSRATWHILVCNYKIHISDTDVPSSNTRVWSLAMQNTDSYLSICYLPGEISLFSSQLLLQTVSGVFVDIRQWALQSAIGLQD